MHYVILVPTCGGTDANHEKADIVFYCKHNDNDWSFSKDSKRATRFESAARVEAEQLFLRKKFAGQDRLWINLDAMSFRMEGR